MRVLVCMPSMCPWSSSLALSLQRLGAEIFVCDILRRNETGLVTSQVSGIIEDWDQFQAKISGFKRIQSVLPDRLQYVVGSVQLRAYASAINADIILTLSGAGYYVMAYTSGFRPYAAYVVGSDVLLAGRLQTHLNRLALGAASVVFTNGQYLAKRTREQVPEGNVIPLLIGVDFEYLTPGSGMGRPIQFVCTRGFEPIYNNRAIIEALARFPKCGPDFRIIFVSGGSQLPECISLADRLLLPAIRQRIVFLGGTDYGKLVEILGQSHVFLSMSLSDGTSTAVLEALATGLYPILSNIPQNQILIRNDSRHGICVAPDDSEGLKDAMLFALNNYESLRPYALRNREYIKDSSDRRKNSAVLFNTLQAVSKCSDKAARCAEPDIRTFRP